MNGAKLTFVTPVFVLLMHQSCNGQRNIRMVLVGMQLFYYYLILFMLFQGFFKENNQF